jgi:hypothetical protein
MSAIEWLTPKQAAEVTGFTEGTLAAWRSRRKTEPGLGPDFRKVGRAIRYERAELDRFIVSGGHAAA